MQHNKESTLFLCNMLKNIKPTAKFSSSDIIYHSDINKQRYYQWEFSNEKRYQVMFTKK